MKVMVMELGTRKEKGFLRVLFNYEHVISECTLQGERKRPSHL